jgi:hypothetical protein
MNLKALNLKWALAFIGATVVGAIGVVLVLTLTGSGDKQATAQPADETPTTVATVAPGPTEPHPSSYSPYTFLLFHQA